MAQARRIDNLPVHGSAGSLAIDLSARNRPPQQTVARTVPLVLPTVFIHWPSPQLDTPQLRGILLAKAYSEFFHDPAEQLSKYNLAAAIGSMYTNILDPNQVSREGQLRTVFGEAGMDLVFVEYNTAEQVYQLLNDPKVQQFFDMFQGDAFRIYRNERDQQILCVGIILLTIGKSVNPDNYDGWIKNRLRTFSGSLGILPDNCIWTEAQCPPQDSLATSYAFLSASFTLRRLLFLICVSAARDTRRLSSIFREVVMFLQGVEMGHIIMIDRYIFSKYPELLRIRALRDNMANMNAAWEFLASLDPGNRYFAKLLFTKDATAVLNRNNFSLLATAAIAAAQFEIPSMRFYRGGNITGTTGAIAEVVKQYLSLRMNLAYYGVMKSGYAYMSEEEKQKYLVSAEAAFGAGTLLELPKSTQQEEERPIPRMGRE